MPLKSEEEKHPYWRLLLFGIPSFIFALVVSFGTHLQVHSMVSKTTCSVDSQFLCSGLWNLENLSKPNCPEASLAALIWTFLLTIFFFTLYLKFPKSLLLASFAFVNASSRIPEIITTFIQILIHQKPKFIFDEYSALTLLNASDPAAYVVILFFAIIIYMSLLLIIINDLKFIPKRFFILLPIFPFVGHLEFYTWQILNKLI